MNNLDDEYTTPAEHDHRIEVCKTCENFTIDDGYTKCLGCNCLLSLLVTYKNQTCPLGKW